LFCVVVLTTAFPPSLPTHLPCVAPFGAPMMMLSRDRPSCTGAPARRQLFTILFLHRHSPHTNRPSTTPTLPHQDHILMDPFQKDFQDNILIEIAIYVMKHAKGDFKPICWRAAVGKC
jgi:hypothetical protein